VTGAVYYPCDCPRCRAWRVRPAALTRRPNPRQLGAVLALPARMHPGRRGDPAVLDAMRGRHAYPMTAETAEVAAGVLAWRSKESAS
jgi:hypothetical protein